MSEDFLRRMLPSPGELGKLTGEISKPAYREANGHIHTPYSFSAFRNIDEAMAMAEDEEIKVLGINDFYVTDGYSEFLDKCLENRVFPLFNIEFIGLLKEEQKKGIRINDPNNPGRIYFTGKGLDFPFHLAPDNVSRLESVKEETQNQLRAMTGKLNSIIAVANPSVVLDFEMIKRQYAHELVRERHIAKALRITAEEHYPEEDERKEFLEMIYGGKASKADFGNPASLENEIRSNLLKAGGRAFVEEDENSFMDLGEITGIILDAGGIPCYPVLLDDFSGNCTEFERDFESLYKALSDMGVGCIELIPGRNDQAYLEKFVRYFDRREFVVTFGTEHNTPELTPLAVTARGEVPLGDSLKQVAWRGICVIAAHQYLRAHGQSGYTGENGIARTQERDTFERTGRSVIEYFLNIS